MAPHKGIVVNEKIMRRIGWFFFIWFSLTFINDWLILKEIGVIPIIYFMNYHQVDPTATMGENAFVIILHGVLAVATLYLLLRKKKLKLH